MEDVVISAEFWNRRRVLVTGHTGFKGSWLSLWLQAMGAEVHGYSFVAPTTPNMFAVCDIRSGLASHTIADIRDSELLASAINGSQAEVVFHLAAQSLVRQSYAAPIDTYSTNVMGTANLLDAVRNSENVRAVVNITTDKCYENREWVWAYRETDRLGGFDPYACSKACSELISRSYTQAFLSDRGVGLATARAGNVIGGGDWACDRLVPDVLRAFDSGRQVELRNPLAIRPWQHVLEPLAGYLQLAEKLIESPVIYSDAWNFGPDEADAATVESVVRRVSELLGRESGWGKASGPNPHEARYLRLDASKAKSELGWRPRWLLDRGLKATVEWHLAWKKQSDMNAFSLQQISSYQNDLNGKVSS